MNNFDKNYSNIMESVDPIMQIASRLKTYISTINGPLNTFTSGHYDNINFIVSHLRKMNYNNKQISEIIGIPATTVYKMPTISKKPENFNYLVNKVKEFPATPTPLNRKQYSPYNNHQLDVIQTYKELFDNHKNMSRFEVRRIMGREPHKFKEIIRELKANKIKDTDIIDILNISQAQIYRIMKWDDNKKPLKLKKHIKRLSVSDLPNSHQHKLHNIKTAINKDRQNNVSVRRHIMNGITDIFNAIDLGVPRTSLSKFLGIDPSSLHRALRNYLS